MSKPMSRFGISAITVSVELSDKNYGTGSSSFMSIGSRLPDNAQGLPLSIDEAIEDGLDKYLAAWQTLMQAALANNQIESGEYVRQTKRYLRRIETVRRLYRKVLEAKAV